MKKSLLEIVKDILSDTDSEDVNSISDTVEALQVAKIVESTFYDIISTRSVPEHQSLIKLTSLSDSAYPTHFVMEDNQATVTDIWYDVGPGATYEYRKLKYLDPVDFIQLVDKRGSGYTLVQDKVAGTWLRILNDSQPNYYTSFDDDHIVMDSFDSTVDTTLQESKIRALGVTYPTFPISDSYVPDVDANHFPYLIQEAKSRFFSAFKGQIDQKVEQAARRQKVYIQNDKRKFSVLNKMRRYGRG